MSNASPYFRRLLLPKRIHFLLPDVLKILSEVFEKEESKEPFIFVKQEDAVVKVKTVSNILKCRQVCKSWQSSIDQFIEDTSQPLFFDVDLPSPNKRGLSQAKYTYFGPRSRRPNDFIAHFEQTHSPLLHQLRNPFIGRLVIIHLPEFNIPVIPDDIQNERKNEVITLLRHYGQHIRILNIDLPYGWNEVQNHLWLLECLSLTPNLTHLKVTSFGPDTDMQFGEHIYHRRVAPIDPVQRERFERQLDELVEMLHNLGDVELAEPVDHVDIELSPLHKLKCLKLCRVPVVSFNSLIQAYRHVIEWLHVEPAYHRPSPNYLEWRQMEFQNLNTVYIPLESPAAARQLGWANLTRVHLEYRWDADFFEWRNLFEIIEASWGDTLIELKLRLPKPSNPVERAMVMRDAIGCRLTLPKLKRLKIWMWSTMEFIVPPMFLETGVPEVKTIELVFEQV